MRRSRNTWTFGSLLHGSASLTYIPDRGRILADERHTLQFDLYGGPYRLHIPIAIKTMMPNVTKQPKLRDFMNSPSPRPCTGPVRSSLAIGLPQCGHVGAASETWRWQSGQGMSGMMLVSLMALLTDLSRLHVDDVHAMISSRSHTRFVTPAAMTGVTRRLRWIRTKLYHVKCKARAALRFSLLAPAEVDGTTLVAARRTAATKAQIELGHYS